MKRETILTILLAIAVLLLLKDCNSNGKDITFKTKEVKGGFEIVKPRQTDIVGPSVDLLRTTVNKGTDQDNRSKTAKSGPSVDQALNTKLLAENEALIKAFATYTDSVKQAKYNEAISLKDFSQTFNDTSLTVNVFGKVRGEVIGIGINYTIKPQTINATIKQYTVFLGVNTVSNPSFSNTAVLPTISYLNANGLLISGGKDLLSKDGYMVGVQKSVWSRSRVKAK